MSETFSRKWGEEKNRTPFTIRIKETVRPPGPLKKRLVFAIRRIKIQIQTLDKTTDRFSERDKSIFARIVDAVSKHDMARANAAYLDEIGNTVGDNPGLTAAGTGQNEHRPANRLYRLPLRRVKLGKYIHPSPL